MAECAGIETLTGIKPSSFWEASVMTLLPASKSPAATTQLLLRIPFLIQQQRLGSQLAAPEASDLFSNAERLPDLPDGWPDNLYNRVAVVGHPRRSVVPVLERWVQEGNPVEKTYLQGMVKQMRAYRRYAHALEVLSNFQRTFSSSQSIL